MQLLPLAVFLLHHFFHLCDFLLVLNALLLKGQPVALVALHLLIDHDLDLLIETLFKILKLVLLAMKDLVDDHDIVLPDE